MKRTKNDNTIVQHLEEDDLISYLDGELPRDEQEQTRSHLESCWSCRTRLATRQDSVENFVRLRQEVLLPRELPPEGPTLNVFRHRLEAHVESYQTRPRLALDLARLRSTLRGLGRRLERDRLAYLTSPIAIRVAVGVVAVAILAVIGLRSNRVTSVSANELIQRAIDAETISLRATAQPVIHQRLQVQRRTQASEMTVNWEIWSDTVNSRIVEKCEGCSDASASKVKAVPLKSDLHSPAAHVLVVDLKAVLVANQMDPDRPLSATSYRSWHSTLRGQRDEVSKSNLVNGTAALTLRTVSANVVSAGEISEAAFVVRASDWQPRELRLTVKSGGGDQRYELTALLSEVVSLSQVDANIFVGTQGTASNRPSTTELETRNSKLETSSPLTLSPSPLSASAELEVEVLRLLHQAGADMGEQITVKRSQDGPVRVSGIVESDQRKAEISAALSSVATNPAVQIDIQTVAEALAERREKRDGPRSTSVEGVEVAADTFPAYQDLRQRMSDEEARVFAARMVSRSHSAMRHAWALKRLMSQFSVRDLAKLQPEAHAKWINLIKSHARAFENESRNLRSQLEPIFGTGSAGVPPASAAITDDASLVRAVDRLVALAGTNYEVVRSAFTITRASSGVSAIRSSQFLQSIRSAEAVAATIARAP